MGRSVGGDRTVIVTAALYVTTLTCGVSPMTGKAPLPVTISGQLGYDLGDGNLIHDALCDSETIQIYIDGTPQFSVLTANSGNYSLGVVLPEGIHTIYAYYAGNETKNFEGCEKMDGTVTATGEPQPSLMLTIGILAGIGLGAYLLTR